DSAKTLELILDAQSIARLHLDRCHAVRGQACQSRARCRDERIFGPCPEVANRRMDPAASPCDLHVIETCGAHLLLFEPRASEQRMGVRVDKTWRKDAAGAVDLRCLRELLPKVRQIAHRGDAVSDHRYSDIRAYSGVTHLRATSRAWRT